MANPMSCKFLSSQFQRKCLSYDLDNPALLATPQVSININIHEFIFSLTVQRVEFLALTFDLIKLGFYVNTV